MNQKNFELSSPSNLLQAAEQTKHFIWFLALFCPKPVPPIKVAEIQIMRENKGQIALLSNKCIRDLPIYHGITYKTLKICMEHSLIDHRRAFALRALKQSSWLSLVSIALCTIFYSPTIG